MRLCLKSDFQGPSPRSAVLQSAVITLREGLEAFLIVAISLAYLRKTGRSSLAPAVHWGVLASVLISVVAACEQLHAVFGGQGPANVFEVFESGAKNDTCDWFSHDFWTSS